MRPRIIIACLLGSLVLIALVSLLCPRRTVSVTVALSKRDVVEIETICAQALRRALLSDVVWAFERRSFQALPRTVSRRYKYHLQSIERTSAQNAIAWIASGNEVKWGYVLEQTNGVWRILFQSYDPPSKTNTNPRNPRSALDARTAVCLHIEARWPRASESERSAIPEKRHIWAG